MSYRVRNLVTGLVHDVPAGHPALSDDKHEVLQPEPDTLEGESLEDLTVPELRDLADERGVDLTGVTRKADIIDALQEA